MLNKQGFNGNIGETKTAAILAEDFLVSTISVDIEGRDFMVEMMPSSLIEIQESKKRITCRGIVQAKFFENNNEVKIAKQYVEDIEGVKTDFFTLIHTIDNDRTPHVYFFTAYEIQKHFTLRTDDNKDYYIFRLSAKKKFLKNKNIPNHKINAIIKHEISHTEEYRNEEFIRRISEKWINPTGEKLYSNNELFKSIKGKHIVDKLYITLNSYNDFRRVHGWRLGEKVSFHDKINTHTYYNNFTLRTNNQQIIDFFSNIKIEKSVKIKDKSFFIGVIDVVEKINTIVLKLNQANINFLDAGRNKTSIALQRPESCQCPICAYESLDFSTAEKAASLQNESDNWHLLQNVDTLFNLGKYQKAKNILDQVLKDALSNKEFVISFICKYNLQILGHYVLEEESFNLYFELLKLDISTEKKEILKFVSEQSLLNSYLKQIDESYLKIKDYQQRQVNNSTYDLLKNQRITIIECVAFYQGNRFLITEDFDLIFEKYIESCIISFSMQSDYRQHLDNFDDFIIKCIFMYCDPQKLIAYFQRNSISDIPYISDNNDYYMRSLFNFFSDENINFLKTEIKVVDGEIENYTIRRKVIKIFSNICIIISYVDLKIEESLIHRISRFIKELDLSLEECSFLAHPILKKTSLFTIPNLTELVRILLKKDDDKGFLLTNCLYGLTEKNYSIGTSDNDIIEPIIDIILLRPDYHTLRPFSKILDSENLKKLKQKIDETLDANFDLDLYYEAVISDCLTNPIKFSKRYSLEIIKIINRNNPVFLGNLSTVTGFSNYITSKLGKLIEIIYIIGDRAIDKPTLKKVKKLHPYYNFVLDIKNYRAGNTFQLSWLGENPSNIILERLSSCEELKQEIKKTIDGTTHKNILKIYFRYFSK